MAWGEPLGLDELMIVNPSPSNSDAYTGAYFLGANGMLYQVQGLGVAEESQGSDQFFLGEDGTLYQVQSSGQIQDLQSSEQYFLGEDGTLYQVQGMHSGDLSDASMRQHTCRCRKKKSRLT
jgi:hypothetical protein